MDDDQDWAPAVMASDYDGDLHLVALTDDVEDWEVTVTGSDGEQEVVEPSESGAFYYYPALADRPCWYIGWAEGGPRSFELRIGGRLIRRLRGNKAGNIPDDGDDS